MKKISTNRSKDPSIDPISAYVERVQPYFDTNMTVAEYKQVAVFLCILGNKICSPLRICPHRDCQASALTGCRAALKEQNKHVYVVVYV